MTWFEAIPLNKIARTTNSEFQNQIVKRNNNTSVYSLMEQTCVQSVELPKPDDQIVIFGLHGLF